MLFLGQPDSMTPKKVFRCPVCLTVSGFASVKCLISRHLFPLLTLILILFVCGDVFYWILSCFEIKLK